MVLPRFSQALEQHRGEFNSATQYWRYRGGRLPKLLMWLVERPELAEALAEDARALGRENGTVAQDRG
jgi:hypothetical protein